MWYLLSAIVMFIITLFANFFAQKWWTFRDTEHGNTHRKFALFILNAILYLGLNTVLLHLFVEVFGIWYLFAQTIVTGILMVMNYVFYSTYVFRVGNR